MNPAPAQALYTVEQVRQLERFVIGSCGIGGFELMQRAAEAAFASLRRRWPQARRLLVLAGDGNNGGDAFLLAVRARAYGCAVSVVALAASSRGADAARARAQWIDGGSVVTLAADADRAVGAAWNDVDVVVDGLFGTGFARALEGDAARLVATLPAGVPVLALDVPSGLDADTGVAPGTAMRAAATVTFIGWKRGLFTADGPDHCGTLELASLDIPATARERVEADGVLLDARAGALPPRRANVNKGSFGHVLVIGGDDGMGGAVRLAGEAALRVGAGLVSVATRAVHAGMIHAARPELIVRAADGPQSIEGALTRADVVAIGPGLHALDATLGTSFQSSQTKTGYTEGQDFPSDAYRYIASAAKKTD
ncbi:MAG: NAD(P)H-hydrate epimerase, partial [Xanthomonadales bacterium]|nr:NAD(P)H-hydrate epimerase [Xanthomonadales bacterium]